MFRLLLTVSGVGPSLAIKLLSGCPHEELRAVIDSEDLASLKRVRGVGAKTAQRILVDLKGAIAGLLGASDDEGAKPDSGGGGHAAPRGRALEDALLALLALGYPRASAEKALRKVRDDGGGGEAADDWVREALRKL